jgi:hypothetical protein
LMTLGPRGILMTVWTFRHFLWKKRSSLTSLRPWRAWDVRWLRMMRWWTGPSDHALEDIPSATSRLVLARLSWAISVIVLTLKVDPHVEAALSLVIKLPRWCCSFQSPCCL